MSTETPESTKKKGGKKKGSDASPTMEEKAVEIAAITKAFAPKSGGLAPPKRQGRRAAPTAPPMKLRDDPSVFFKENDLSPNTNSVFLYAINLYIIEYRNKKSIPSQIYAIKAEYFKENLDVDQKLWLEAVNGDLECWCEYAYDLIACFQVKALQVENINSYFAATNSAFKVSNTTVAMLAYAAIQLERLEVYELRESSKAWNPFIDYHTRAFSSASLVIRFAQTFPKIMESIFPGVNLEVIKEIDNQSWNLAASNVLPKPLLGAVSIWVTYAGIVRAPNRWYQGEKARNMLPVKEVTMWERFFKAEERIGLPDFDDKDTINDMVDKMIAGGFSKDSMTVLTPELKPDP